MTQTEMHKGAGGSSSKQAQKRGRGGKVAVKLGPGKSRRQLSSDLFGGFGKVFARRIYGLLWHRVGNGNCWRVILGVRFIEGLEFGRFGDVYVMRVVLV